MDIGDCVSVLQHFIDEGVVDSKRVAVCGGSHGGFLTGHAIVQHAALFKAAVMRNPVLDIALMSRVRSCQSALSHIHERLFAKVSRRYR
jgi:acylaminoacyl-peptidase